MSNNGRSQRPNQQRNKRASVGMSFERSVDRLSSAGRETLNRVHQKRRKSLNTKPYNSTAVFDNYCPHYRWLRWGWLVEERCVPSGRLYRYYYDPMGKAYSTRKKVEDLFQDLDKDRVTIILDDKSTLYVCLNF